MNLPRMILSSIQNPERYEQIVVCKIRSPTPNDIDLEFLDRTAKIDKEQSARDLLSLQLRRHPADTRLGQNVQTPTNVITTTAHTNSPHHHQSKQLTHQATTCVSLRTSTSTEFSIKTCTTSSSTNSFGYKHTPLGYKHTPQPSSTVRLLQLYFDVLSSSVL